MSRDKTLSDLKRLALDIANIVPGSAEPPVPFFRATTFYNAEYGWISLSGEQERIYREIIESLCRLTPGASEKFVKDLVDQALFKAADIKKSMQGVPVAARVASAVAEVGQALSAPCAKWVSCIPILGIKPPAEPWQLGDLTLIDIESNECQELLQRADYITDSTTNSPEAKEHAKRDLRKALVEDHRGQAFALFTSNALDADAAWRAAKRGLRFKFDCLNYVVDCLHGNLKLYEFSDSEPLKRHFETGLVINATDWSFHSAPSSVTAPVGSLDAGQLRSDIEKWPALVRLCALLASEQNNKHEKRVLTAIHWAGRASAERRPEEAFIFRAIALESLILGSGDHSELTQRLALSVVHLLGDALRDRKDAVTQIRSLYAVRSKIVHSGTYEISEKDARLLREFVLMCFAYVLADERFKHMSGGTDLDEWFQAAMRGDVS